MEKLKMKTPDLTDKNIEQIATLFPHVMTEIKDEHGTIKKAIDFDLLKQSLSGVLADDDDERYRLDWPGKKASLLKANIPISKTLRPCREESVDFDTTENLYIEGDNFEVLKILQESYLGKIKMIYIDPPYNTGKDFIYRDNFRVGKNEYEEEIGAVDEDGDKLFKNTDSNGRFHSDWLSMMYERLIVARDLLRDDGVIFISIDDNEVHNLRKICDEVFGEDNIVGNIAWKKTSGDNKPCFAFTHDNILIFGKNTNQIPRVALTPKQYKQYKNPDNDYRGDWAETDYRSKWSKDERKNLYYGITHPLTGEKIYPDTFSNTNRVWACAEETHLKNVKDNLVWWGIGGKNNEPKKKRFLSKHKGANTRSVWLHAGMNDEGGQELKKLLEGDFFDNPKPIKLLKRIEMIMLYDDDIILDFFAGSSTTAHAVMQLNAEDNGNRKFIMVQLPEKTDEKSEAHKAGYKTIAEIGKERIRRAGKKIKEELEKKNRQLKLGEDPVDSDKLDIGFRVYKTDDSNMKDIYYHPEKLDQLSLPGFESNIKEDRTPDDLITQVILNLGLTLDLPIETKKIFGNTVFIVQTNALVACFDENINLKIVDDIAALKPFKVVFKDAGFADDKDRINVEEQFKGLSPETVITVI